MLNDCAMYYTFMIVGRDMINAKTKEKKITDEQRRGGNETLLLLSEGTEQGTFGRQGEEGKLTFVPLARKVLRGIAREINFTRAATTVAVYAPVYLPRS